MYHYKRLSLGMCSTWIRRENACPHSFAYFVYIFVYMLLYLFISAVLSFNHNTLGFSVCPIPFHGFHCKWIVISRTHKRRMFTYHGSKSRQFFRIKWKNDDVLYCIRFDIFLYTKLRSWNKAKLVLFNKNYDPFLIF